MNYYHVDVFSNKSYAGNGLTVVIHNEELSEGHMQEIAKEFKQFETIFIMRTGENKFRTRIFTVDEELDFAGHPVLGGVAVVHDYFYKKNSIKVIFELNRKTVEVVSEKKEGFYSAIMNQGKADFYGTVKSEDRELYLNALNLTLDNLYEKLPMQIVSTGLKYLIVPLKSGIEKANICIPDIEELLSKVGAKFVYLFDVDNMEGRTWDNIGKVEDVATGSAAGPTAAYLWNHQIKERNSEIIINQGRFLGRPSQIRVSLNDSDEVFVAGDVKILAVGELKE